MVTAQERRRAIGRERHDVTCAPGSSQRRARTRTGPTPRGSIHATPSAVVHAARADGDRLAARLAMRPQDYERRSGLAPEQTAPDERQPVGRGHQPQLGVGGPGHAAQRIDAQAGCPAVRPMTRMTPSAAIRPATAS